MNARRLLTILILAGLLAGAVVGQILHSRYGTDMPGWTDAFRIIGKDIFMRSLRMLVIPLIISSVIVGVTSVGNFRHLGSLGGKTLTYYLATMFGAVIVGLVLVNLMQPGIGFFQGEQGEYQKQQYLAQGAAEFQDRLGQPDRPASFSQALLGIVVQMIPENPLAAAANGEALPTIMFSLLFGILLTTIGPGKQVVVAFFQAVMAVMIRMTELVLWLAPVGVFCLVAVSVAGVGLETFTQRIGLYMFTVLAGLAIHGFVVLPAVLWLFTHSNPLAFFWAMRPALLMALSTASSSATLPVTIETAAGPGRCSKRATGFVLPLGSTVNMDGTALYEAVAVVFLAQAFSPVPLDWGQMIVVALTATLAAIGAAGIPEAGLTTMILVVSAVNQSGMAQIPPEAIALVLGVDRILDMCRTSINVWGDSVGAKIISQSEPDVPTGADEELAAVGGPA
jgi:Na+/H+-dicarboxylate symporter